MNHNEWYEQEEDQLVEDLNNGLITREHFNQAMRELNREMRSMTEEAAQEAYDREMENWR